MLKIRPQIRILSIVPGTKYLGIALFYGSELRDWRIKVLNAKGIEEKIKKAKEIISDFIERYNPRVLTVKKLNLKRSSKNLNNLTRKIKEVAKRKGLTIWQLELSGIKKFIAGKRRMNKKELSQIIVSRYPELLFDFKKERKNKNTYYEKMFEAVALGLTCFYKVDGKLSLNKRYGKNKSKNLSH